jgi:hypothetical protein
VLRNETDGAVMHAASVRLWPAKVDRVIQAQASTDGRRRGRRNVTMEVVRLARPSVCSSMHRQYASTGAGVAGYHN